MIQLLISLLLGLGITFALAADFLLNFWERYCDLPFWVAAILPLVFFCSFYESQKKSGAKWTKNLK